MHTLLASISLVLTCTSLVFTSLASLFAVGTEHATLLGFAVGAHQLMNVRSLGRDMRHHVQ